MVASSTSSSTTISAASSSPLIFQQTDQNSFSSQSWYDDNWFDLGSGFNGTVTDLTLNGKINAKEFFASHVLLQEFKDMHYTATSTVAPPPLTTPTDLGVSFDPLAMQLALTWGTSTDPDWSATAPIPVIAGNSYLIGVRAVDNFGDISGVVTTTWHFPPGFVLYKLSPGLSYANQKFIVATDTVLNSIRIFTSNFQTGARNPDAASCLPSLFYSDGTSSYRTIGSDGGYVGYGCAGEVTFSFASSSPALIAGDQYQWIFQTDTHNPSTDASVQFYGTTIDTAGGTFSDSSLANARFVLNSSSGVIFAN